VDKKIKKEINHDDDKPPILKSWGKIYSLVLITLIVLIILFHYFTKAFE
jgi:hypothetical protein